MEGLVLLARRVPVFAVRLDRGGLLEHGATREDPHLVFELWPRLHESRAHRDLRLEEPGDRASLFLRVRGDLELRSIDPRDLRWDIVEDRLNGPARLGLVVVQGRMYLPAFRPIAELQAFTR